MARIVDILYCYAISFFSGVIIYVVAAVVQLLGIASIELNSEASGALPTIFGMLAIVSYNAVAEAYSGASLGKVICKLRVLAEDGSNCSFRSALIRNAGYFIDGIFFGLVGYMAMSKTPLNQRYGDRWGHTVVVKSGLVPDGSKRSGTDLFVGILFGTTVYSLVIGISLIV